MDDVRAFSATLNVMNSSGTVIAAHRLAEKKTFRIGRTDACDIALPHSWISRRHAMIQVEENGACNLIDLGSSNGTFVNGRRIFTPTRLNTGDRIAVGRTTIVFLQDNAPIGWGATLDDEDREEKTVAFTQKELVTVLVCDIHDYTRLSELIGDSRISALIRIWSGEVEKVVHRHDGMVDKFLGDAVMAVWIGGASPAYNIRQALRAALKISQITRLLGKKIPEIPRELAIGAAINTGEAIVGNVGSDGRRDFTVIGDTVNVAFRLEGMTTQSGFDLLMGRESASYLDGVDSHFAASSSFVKGKEKKVQSHGCSFEALARYLEGVGRKK